MDKIEVAGRRQARECVYKMLFEYSFRRQINQHTYDMCYVLLPDDVKPYFQNTLDGAIAHYDEMVSLIMTKVKGYSSPDRLNRTDLAAMIYAAYELTYRQDIPEAVVIKETIELAKEYGGEKSGGFVNGVLGAIVRDR
jgi:N utilization substance protein B